MLSYQSRHSFLLIALLAATIFFFHDRIGLKVHNLFPNEQSTTSNAPKYAFATFLSSRLSDESDNDKYFASTRMLAYQLLHQPSTRSAYSYPFLVLVSPHVSMHKRKILRDEGCRVVPIELLKSNWTVGPDEGRLIDQFTKLRVFELEGFDRILFMDSDMLLTRPLDDIWTEEVVTEPRKTKKNHRPIAPGEANMPEDYVVAGITDDQGGSLLTGGFLVLRPCKKLFQYYLSLLEAEPRFDVKDMDMGLLNYAHRHEGSMPWTVLSSEKWSSTWPSLQDLR